MEKKTHKKTAFCQKAIFVEKLKKKHENFSLVWHCCLDFAELSTDKMIADSFRRI